MSALSNLGTRVQQDLSCMESYYFVPVFYYAFTMSTVTNGGQISQIKINQKKKRNLKDK